LRDTVPDLTPVVSQFSCEGRFVDARRHGSGHINDTFVVRCERADGPVRYVLQRINEHVFRDVPALMENVSRVCAHLATQATTGATRRGLTLVPPRDGGTFHRDAAGDCWRAYHFIAGASTWDIARSPRDAFEAARAFGEFQVKLVDLSGPRLRETIPHFHDTRRRFEVLRAAGESGLLDRIRAAGAELEFARAREGMVDVLLDLHRAGKIPERTTHNDTKLNNVMLDDKSGEAVCVVDLDTVMPGLALYDFGDLVRSATNSAAEDEVDLARVAMQLPVFRELVRGYAAATAGLLNPTERAHLAFAGRLITFEVGIRFLTDFLQGDVYFKTARPGHNLDRARCQFALLRSMEEQRTAMEHVVAEAAP
jgi:Ser/Thr protein kinase RdoA (MazF antagonist)